MQDDEPIISDKTRRVLEQNHIPASEMTSSELKDLDQEVNE